MSILRILPVVLVICGGPAVADVLLIEAVSAEAAELRPTRGMTMAHVERRFGAPRERFNAVGDPPISRWEYEGYTVYFEHQHVLHSVTHRALKAAADSR